MYIYLVVAAGLISSILTTLIEWMFIYGTERYQKNTEEIEKVQKKS
jgi:hypothetical protein